MLLYANETLAPCPIGLGKNISWFKFCIKTFFLRNRQIWLSLKYKTYQYKLYQWRGYWVCRIWYAPYWNTFLFQRWSSCLSVTLLGGGGECNHCPWCIGPYCNPLHSSDIWWPKLDTCSNLFTWGHHCTGPQLVLTSGGGLHTSGQYPPHWNAFLFHVWSSYVKGNKYWRWLSILPLNWLKALITCRS